jgi:hypothetical protein
MNAPAAPFTITDIDPGQALPMLGAMGGRIQMRDVATGQLFTMDLGPADVHIPAAVNNFVTGYSNGEMIADKVAAPFLTNKATDYFWQYQPDNALATADNTMTAPGGAYPTINPAIGNTQFLTNMYTLGAVIPMETIANQDEMLNIVLAAMKTCMDKLLLNREVRVKNLAFTTGTWNSGASLVLGLGPTQKWNGGSAADPIANIKQIYQASLMPPTHMVMGRRDWDNFVTNPAVQKYVAFKPGAKGIPAPGDGAWSALLDLPIPIIGEAKAKNAAGAYPYVWDSNVVLIRSVPKVSMYDATSLKTFRWNGAGGPKLPTEFGGTVENGWTIRQFYDFTKGPKGSMVVVVSHHDAETITGGPGASSYIGGLITGTYQ